MGIMSVWSIPILKKKEKEKKKVFSYFLLLMSIVQLHLNSTHPLWKIQKHLMQWECEFQVDTFIWHL